MKTQPSTELGLLLASDGLDPAEGLLDPLADSLAERITAMPRCPPVDRRTSTAGVLGDMGRHPHRAQLVDEVLGVICLVGTKGDHLRSIGVGLDHGECRNPLGMPIGRRQTSANQKTEAVLHQAVTHEA